MRFNFWGRMKRQFLLVAISFAISIIFYLSEGWSALIKPPGLVLVAATELSSFSTEWCAVNSIGETSVARVCFGSILFQGHTSVRALAFITSAGERLLYMDSEFRGIDMQRTDIEIIGPIGSGKIMEIGRAVLSFDANGDVAAIQARTSKAGLVAGIRP